MTKRLFKATARAIAIRVVTRLFIDLPTPKSAEDLRAREKEVYEIALDRMNQFERHPPRD